MKIAILVTNTDRSAFADRFPKDGEKFSALLRSVRPDWQISAFDLVEGDFPEDTSAFDGFVITGSPASVHDDFPWIAELNSLILSVYKAGQPIFGACFGHQAIAEALGGEVSDNPAGWVLGTVETVHTNRPEWVADLPDDMKFYAAHKEQVVKLPEDAEVIAQHATCKIAGFHIGSKIYTTQYHPEMDHRFIGALIEELAGTLPDEVISKSRTSLKHEADNAEFAESLARFFEQA